MVSATRTTVAERCHAVPRMLATCNHRCGHRADLFSAADHLNVPLIGGIARKQPGADGDPMIDAESSWS